MKYHYIFPRNNVLYPQANFSKWMWQNDGRQKEQRACNYLISWLATGTRQQWSSQVRARQGLSSLNYMPALKHYRRKSTNWRPSAHKICSKITGTLEKHFQKQRLTHRNWKWACQKGPTTLRPGILLKFSYYYPISYAVTWLTMPISQ